MFLAGVDGASQTDILAAFPFELGSLPVRYLGLPLTTKRMTVSDYTPLLDRIRKRICSWTARQLSFAGRLQLLGSVIHSITNFWMSVFRLPKQCINEIDKMCSAFLWSGPDLNPRKAKISWKDVCKPKEEGGLGLRSLEDTNKVCMLKLIWRILSTTDSLWVRWVHRYLIRKGSIWNVNSKSQTGSWIWRKVLKYRELARQFSQMEVGDGSTVSFWFDNWSPLGRVVELTGSRGCIDLGIPIHATVERAVQQFRQRRYRSNNLILIANEVVKLQAAGLSHHADKAQWKGRGDIYKTVFSSTQTWELIREVRPKVTWSKGIWFTLATPKYSVVAWIAIHNRLATGDRIQCWNPQADATCILCKTQNETRNHLFFTCSYSGLIWRKLTMKLMGNHYSNNWDDILRSLMDTTSDCNTLLLLRSVFQASIHSIWRERNARRHGEPSTDPSLLARYIDKHIRNRIDSMRGKVHKKYDKAMQLWFASR
ncbi:hypothetical protein Bca101_023911 [Brassica carinata]